METSKDHSLAHKPDMLRSYTYSLLPSKILSPGTNTSPIPEGIV